MFKCKVALEYFFKNSTLLNVEVKLNQSAVISNPKQFIKSHLEIIKANNGNLIYLPYLERLQKLKDILSE